MPRNRIIVTKWEKNLGMKKAFKFYILPIFLTNNANNKAPKCRKMFMLNCTDRISENFLV
jgi:hypothetical protein